MENNSLSNSCVAGGEGRKHTIKSLGEKRFLLFFLQTHVFVGNVFLLHLFISVVLWSYAEQYMIYDFPFSLIFCFTMHQNPSHSLQTSIIFGK